MNIGAKVVVVATSPEQSSCRTHQSALQPWHRSKLRLSLENRPGHSTAQEHSCQSAGAGLRTVRQTGFKVESRAGSPSRKSRVPILVAGNPRSGRSPDERFQRPIFMVSSHSGTDGAENGLGCSVITCGHRCIRAVQLSTAVLSRPASARAWRARCCAPGPSPRRGRASSR